MAQLAGSQVANTQYYAFRGNFTAKTSYIILFVNREMATQCCLMLTIFDFEETENEDWQFSFDFGDFGKILRSFCLYC